MSQLSQTATILVVEDDSSIRMGLEDTLRAKGYAVVSTSSAKEALRLAETRDPDLVVLDIMLPDGEGFEVCRELRAQRPDRAVIMLTARGSEIDRVRGLELGADDYITKPFSLMEFLARIQAVLRRTRPAAEREPVAAIALGEVTIDFRRHEAWRAGQPLELSDRAFKILAVFAKHAGEVVSRDQLLREAWGYERGFNTRTVDNHVVKIRQAVEEDAEAPRYLVTVWGVGYKLVVDAE